MSEPEIIPQGKYVVPALAQGLAVLGLFSREQPSLTAPEIANRLGLSRTTVFRLLHTLQIMGFVRRDENERHYSLGPALLSRGFEFVASLDIVEIAQPILRQLRDQTGLSAHMAVRDGGEVVYVIRHPARSTIASSVNIGTRFPAHATVMGRMMLSEMSEAELRKLFPTDPLPRYTEQTPQTLASLMEILAEDRKRGYSVSQSFFEQGVSSIAAPVRDGAGNIVAAINITAVDAYIDVGAMHGPLKDAVLAAASEIGRWLRRDTSIDTPPREMPPQKRSSKNEPVHV